MRHLPAESIFSNTILRQDVFSVHSCCKKKPFRAADQPVHLHGTAFFV